MGSGCIQPALGGSGPLCLPSSSHLGQSGGVVARLPDPDFSRVPQHTLVLGPSIHVEPDPIVPAESAQSVDSAVQPDPPQEFQSNLNLHAWLLAPLLSKSRASLRQWQSKLRLLRESQPDQPMRQSGPLLQSGCHSNQVDFRVPSIKSIKIRPSHLLIN